MNKLSLNLFLFISITLVLSIVLAKSFNNLNVKAAVGHAVISEVQLGAADADDEFVELYNPTGSSIDLTGWRLTRKTSTGTQTNLVASLSGALLPNSYFLIAPAIDYTGSPAADLNYSTATRIASNNTILIYSDAGTTLVDKLGFGTATDIETIAFTTNPTSGQSAERKANSTSTDVSMGTGGGDELAGNGEDTDSNANDFVLKTTSQPQNSSSAAEPVVVSPAPSPSASPSAQPSASPSPSVEPSPSPSPASPSPSVVPSPSTSPSASPSATPKVIGIFTFPNKTTICKLSYTQLQIGSIKIKVPHISCTTQ